LWSRISRNPAAAEEREGAGQALWSARRDERSPMSARQTNFTWQVSSPGRCSVDCGTPRCSGERPRCRRSGYYSGRCTKDCNGQITAGVERCCACYHRHSEVRSQSWSDTVQPTALTRRSRPGSLQTGSDSSPVSERPRTTVSVRTLHPSLQC